MRFTNEVGGIVDRDGNLLHIIEGSPGLVVFPQDILYLLHKKNPGIVFNLVHTHPPRMSEMSNEDISTLKAQALWTHPFPARMSVITEIADGLFKESRWMGYWQSKEDWERDKTRAREFYRIKDKEFTFECGWAEDIMRENSYCSILTNRSYYL